MDILRNIGSFPWDMPLVLIVTLLIGCLFIRRFKIPFLGLASHQRAALPLHSLIVKLFGFLAFVCVLGGLLGVVLGSTEMTSFELLGAKFSTTHVGIAFVGIGLLVNYFTVRAVLKNQLNLAQIPKDESRDDG